MAREFKFKSTVEEVKINDRNYGIDFSDEKIREYQSKLRTFQDETLEFQNIDAEKLSKEEEETYYAKTKEMVQKVVDALLGEGSFETLYNESGKSLMNMIDLVMFLSEMIEEKASSVKQEKVEKYLKNKTKKR